MQRPDQWMWDYSVEQDIRYKRNLLKKIFKFLILGPLIIIFILFIIGLIMTVFTPHPPSSSNPAVHPLPQVNPTESPIGMSTNINDILGSWKWGDGQIVTFYSDGTMKSYVGQSLFNHGSWEFNESLKYPFIARWQNGFIDNFVISSDGKYLIGHNQWTTIDTTYAPKM